MNFLNCVINLLFIYAKNFTNFLVRISLEICIENSFFKITANLSENSSITGPPGILIFIKMATTNKTGHKNNSPQKDTIRSNKNFIIIFYIFPRAIASIFSREVITGIGIILLNGYKIFTIIPTHHLYEILKSQ